MTSTAISAMLQLQGLPPLPRSLTGYTAPFPGNTYSQLPPALAHHEPPLLKPSAVHGQHFNLLAQPRRTPPIPPPRPQSRRSSSSGSSFRASPDHLTNRSGGILGSGVEMLRSSPRSLSSSPHSSHVDSGLGRSSADSSSEGGRAFVATMKSTPPATTRLDSQLRQLRKDMHHLRQQDMALLGHLLQIHQGIQDLRQVLLPSPPMATGPSPLFQSTPSRHSKGQSSSHASSRLSIATKLFSRRSSSDKLMSEAMGLGPDLKTGSGHRERHGHVHSGTRERRDDETDSLSSLEFGDV